MRPMLLLLLPLLLSPVGCVPSLPDRPYPAGGTYRVDTDIRFNLARRDFLLHVPPGLAPDEPLPLLVVLHGAFSTAALTEKETGFSTLADRENFLVAYPEGIGLFGYLQHWNAGHCCGKAADDSIDDVGYVATVIEVVKSRLDVDPRRVYLVGMSNGGMLTYRYGAERTAELAAIAVVAGAIGSSGAGGHPPWRIPTPVAPLPVIAFHGTGDNHIPYQGGPSPLKRGERVYSSVAEAMDFWRRANRCEESPRHEERFDGMLSSFRWSDCQTGAPVEYYLLAGWEHRWPAAFYTTQLPPEHPLYGFDATEEIWRFLRRFSR